MYVLLKCELTGKRMRTHMLLQAWDDAEKAAIAAQEDEEEGAEDLCNCEFSLAYGAKILLNNTRLRLKRGKRYGLCGPNGSGKSTLMRAIVNGQVWARTQKHTRTHNA